MRSLLGRFHRPMSRGTVNNMLTMNNLGDGSTLSLDFTTMGGVLDPRLTFSRASTATFVNSSGYVEYAGANLVRYSQQITTTNWATGANTTLAPNTTEVLDPQGGNTATKISLAANAYSSRAQDIALPGGQTYTFSFWIRGTAGVTCRIYSFAGYVGDLVTETAYSYSTSEWTRVSTTFTTNAATTNVFLYVCSKSTAPASTDVIYVWGAQLNPGSTVQAYYPTTTAAYHAPRFDYSPTNIGEPRGLLIEGSSTNYFLYSSLLSNVTWQAGTGAANDVTMTYPAVGITDPSNGSSAGFMSKPNTSNGYGFFRQTSMNTGAVSGNRTVSCWFKQPTSNAARYVGIRCTGNGFAPANAEFCATFDLQNGVVVANAGTNQYTNVSITAYPNGWYKCSATSGSMGTAFAAIGSVAIVEGVNGNEFNNIQGGTYIWGLQIELGSGASSYIPTGASQVTRNADSCLMSGTNFSSWYTQGMGTVCWSGSAFRITAGHLANINTVNNDPRITAYVGAGSLTNLVTNGTTQASISFGTVTANTAFKAAWRFNTNDFAACLNAGTVYTDTLGTVPTGVDRMQLGAAEGGYQFLDGWIKSIKYYPTAFTNAQLQTATTL